jgi:HAD superfamily hydrolase (TIGR01509 family)
VFEAPSATTALTYDRAVRFSAVLVDVGGTLWPDSVPVDEAARVARVEAVFPGAGVAVPELMEALSVRDDADRAVLELLTTRGLELDEELAASVRKAICAPFSPLGEPLPGAHELLSTIRRLGKRCVVVSNVSVRDAELYAKDFTALGWADLIDACVTSLDTGCRKPGSAIFEAALSAAACAPARCVMIGDSEPNDIQPARVRGMRTICIGPKTVTSAADAVVHGPAECVAVLESWNA